MAALMLQATSLFETMARVMSRPAEVPAAAGTWRATRQSEPLPPPSTSSPSRTLDLSKSRTYDAALDILRAYKLTGNFHINLEIVLEGLGVLDEVTFEVEPVAKLPYHPDCRHVAFRPNGNISGERFTEIICSIRTRLGFDAARPWWICSLGEAHPRAACAADRRPAQETRCAVCGKGLAGDKR